MEIAQIEEGDRLDRRRSRDEEGDSADRRSLDEEGDRPDPRSEEGKQEIVLRHPLVRNEIFFYVFMKSKASIDQFFQMKLKANMRMFYVFMRVLMSFCHFGLEWISIPSQM